MLISRAIDLWSHCSHPSPVASSQFWRRPKGSRSFYTSSSGGAPNPVISAHEVPRIHPWSAIVL